MSLGKIAIGIGVVYVIYRVYKKNKTEEPFVLDDDIKTSNATGWPIASGGAKQGGCYGGCPPSRPICSKGQCI